MLRRQVSAAVISYVRIPAFSVTSLALPIMFFSFFGLAEAGRRFPDGTSVGAYLLASFGAYSVSSVMIFSFGIGVAAQRGQKTDLLQRATPLRPWVAVAASVLNALLFALVSLVLLFAFGAIAGGVRLPAGQWLSMTALLLFGSLPMIAMGMAIGYRAGPNSAPAVANLIYLPMAFASGLFVPIDRLPDFVQRIGPYLPTYHYGEIAHAAVGHGHEGIPTGLAWLAGWSVVLFAAAVSAFRADAQRKFS